MYAPAEDGRFTYVNGYRYVLEMHQNDRAKLPPRVAVFHTKDHLLSNRVLSDATSMRHSPAQTYREPALLPISIPHRLLGSDFSLSWQSDSQPRNTLDSAFLLDRLVVPVQSKIFCDPRGSASGPPNSRKDSQWVNRLLP